MTDAASVRPTEQLDWSRLAAYLHTHLPACQIAGLDLSRQMDVAQFPGGHSNLTYLVRFGDAELVLRRPPFGPVPPTAHDMAREHRWLAALHPVFPLAPRPYLFCDDTSVIGSIFYVMERRHGTVVRHEEPPALADRPDVRRRVSEALVDTLADLHAIDIVASGLSSLGKPSGFVERQVRGWTERWQRSMTAELPEMEALARWLRNHLPPDANPPAVVHGDFKLDNVMLDLSRAESRDLTGAAELPPSRETPASAPKLRRVRRSLGEGESADRRSLGGGGLAPPGGASDVPRVIAVFDWEMCALGDPLVDLGILLAYWAPTAPPGQPDALTSVTDRPGWFTRDQIIEGYAARSGRDVSAIRFYETFALFKVAVVIQQIFYRYVRGQTDDPRFARFGDRVAYLARTAAALAQRA